MLISITNSCNMNCTHCLGDYKLCDDHMTMEKFDDVIQFIKKYKPSFVLVSGGEPTLHPNFIPMMKRLKAAQVYFGIASNGTFLEDEKLTKEIMGLNVPVQITNDVRYYPKRIKYVSHPNFIYVNEIMSLYPQGRAQNEKPIMCRVTKCFNAKMFSYQLKERSFKALLNEFDSRFKYCFPMINFEGDVHAGESRLCTKIGTIYDDDEKLFNGVQNLKCKKCGMNNYVADNFTMLLNSLEVMNKLK